MWNETDKVYNLKGFLVGNGATHWDFDVSPSYPRTLYGFNMIPKKDMDYFDENNCTYYFNDFRPHSGPEGCDAVWNHMNDLAKDLWWYDLYMPADTILDAKMMTPEERMGKTVVDGVEKTYRRGFTPREYTPWLANVNPGSRTLDLVMNDLLTDYLNREDVRAALHIPSDIPAWESCSTTLQYNLAQEGSFWIYPIMKGAGIKMIFYSGDADGAVNTYGTKRWIKELDWDVTTDWTAWLADDGQVAGYYEQYDGLEFATIKGVGHLAPKYAQANMLKLVTNWIHGNSFV